MLWVVETAVFISFSREHDTGYVSRLAAHLAAAGIASRYDSHPMDENWWETYTRAQIDSCSAVVAVMSPQAQGSGWVTRELDYARSLGKPIFPIDPEVSPGRDLIEQLRPKAERAGDGPLVPLHGGKTAGAVCIETRGGVFTPLIDRGSAVPAQRTETFTTADDNQPSIKIRVLASNGEPLGDYELLLRPAPRGVPMIHVTFRVEATGAFRLLAKDESGAAVTMSRV